MVVMIAAPSYLGYFAMKLLGERRGVLIIRLLGGMISSTAANANPRAVSERIGTKVERCCDPPDIPSAVMFPRMLVIAAIVAPQLVGPLTLPLKAAAAGRLAAASWCAWRRIHKDRPSVRPRPLTSLSS
jgi:uncharacterized membrane protein (DUF4010 family)